MSRRARTLATFGMTAALVVGGSACSDEDGDGANSDEEVGELEDRVEEGGDQLEEEVDEGQAETDG